jgi:hypothetical protein
MFLRGGHRESCQTIRTSATSLSTANGIAPWEHCETWMTIFFIMYSRVASSTVPQLECSSSNRVICCFKAAAVAAILEAVGSGQRLWHWVEAAATGGAGSEWAGPEWAGPETNAFVLAICMWSAAGPCEAGGRAVAKP